MAVIVRPESGSCCVKNARKLSNLTALFTLHLPFAVSCRNDLLRKLNANKPWISGQGYNREHRLHPAMTAAVSNRSRKRPGYTYSQISKKP